MGTTARRRYDKLEGYAMTPEERKQQLAEQTRALLEAVSITEITRKKEQKMIEKKAKEIFRQNYGRKNNE